MTQTSYKQNGDGDGDAIIFNPDPSLLEHNARSLPSYHTGLTDDHDHLRAPYTRTNKAYQV